MGNEKYTQKVIEAFQSAQQIAALHYNQEIYVGPYAHGTCERTGRPAQYDFLRNVIQMSPCSRPVWNSY
jgi:hypothetical protein